MRRANVSIDCAVVGTLEETANGSRFTYTAAYAARPNAAAVSLTLPVRAEPYEGTGLLPWFENLLPEGWLLDIATTGLKIPRDDAFGLLLAVGGDTIGAVEVTPA